MATKTKKSIFMCDSCGNESSRWQGQCPFCKEWNTLREFKQPKKIPGRGVTSTKRVQKSKPTQVLKINPKTNERKNTHISELDRALSGGLVPGQVVLLAGQPGVGKSTILLQLADKFDDEVLYVSGEESESQIALRARRLSVTNQKLNVLSESDVDAVIAMKPPKLLIIDSIQTMFTNDFPSRIGSITQVSESASRIIAYSKANHIPSIIVGHITKDGTIAGPKILEHMVDTVLYLEGDKNHVFRMLRVHKNRFGDDSEVGIFVMDAKGLKSVKNPGQILLDDSTAISSGSAIAIILEGSRPLAIEVQALTTKTSFGYPKRAASGFSLNRLQLLCAVLQKHMKINLLDQDVYVNIASGLTVKEPAVDLAVCAAIISSYKNKIIKKGTVYFGEVGLGGEVRRVVGAERREKEAKILGYTMVINSQTVRRLSELKV